VTGADWTKTTHLYIQRDRNKFSAYKLLISTLVHCHLHIAMPHMIPEMRPGRISFG